MNRLFFAIAPFFLCASFLFSSGMSDGKGEIGIFNRALDDFNKGDFAKSTDALQQMAPFRNGKAEEQRLMLISSGFYHQAENKASDEKGSDGALSDVEKSIGFLSGIVEKNPGNRSAANNLEKALLLRDKLKENQSKQQNSSGDEKGDQSPEDQLKNLADKQRDLAQDQSKDSDSHKNEQDNLNKNTENLQNNSRNDNRDYSDNMKDARDAQEKASEALKQGDYEKAADEQNKAADSLDQALASLKGDQKNDGENGQDRQPEQDKSGEDGTNQIIQSILDNETDRNTERINTSGNGITVERNW